MFVLATLRLLIWRGFNFIGNSNNFSLFSLVDVYLLQISLSPAQTQRNEEQIKFLTEKINSLVDEAEQMGIQGNVEQAQGLMKLCDQLKEEREQLRGNNENSHWQQV